jgi:hypothetical protein
MFGSALGGWVAQREHRSAQYRAAIKRQHDAYRQMHRSQIKGSAPKKVIPLAGYIGAVQISGTFYPIRMGKTSIPEVKHGDR